jgi:hypothetical protein
VLDCRHSNPLHEELAMKMHLTTAVVVLAAAPVFGQSAMTGVSNPDPAVITSDAPDTAAKPSAATSSAVVPATAPTASSEVYGAYVPYTGPIVPGGAVASSEPVGDIDAGIITTVPEREGELRQGTLLKTQIKDMLSTSSTVEGSKFTAALTEAIERNGRVILPVGSVLEGRVTEVHGGHRITGAAALHLETSDILLPDGTHYVVHAQLVDAGKSDFRIDDEGTLKRKDHTKEELLVAAGVTGAGAATGAVIGGGVGAIVGASVGAGVSTVLWLKQDRQATLPKDQQLVFSLTTPMVLTPLSGASVSLNAHDAVAGGGAQ